VELMSHEREAYRQARALLGAICALSLGEQRRSRLEALRRAALGAVAPIVASAAQESSAVRVAALRRSHAALDRLAELLEGCRSAGELPEEQAGGLLHAHEHAARAVDRALAGYGGLGASA
jgi:hypothetical protein